MLDCPPVLTDYVSLRSTELCQGEKWNNLHYDSMDSPDLC